MAPNNQYSVVLNLQRWDRTVVALSWRERLSALLTGRMALSDIVGYNCVGWIPVFPDKPSAETYVTEEAPTAPITQVTRRLEE